MQTINDENEDENLAVVCVLTPADQWRSREVFESVGVSGQRSIEKLGVGLLYFPSLSPSLPPSYPFAIPCSARFPAP